MEDKVPTRSPTTPDSVRPGRPDGKPPVGITVPLFRPLIEEEEISAATEALRMGWLGMGSYVQEFEQALVELVGAPDRRVAAVSTGHAALHLALLVAGVGAGDEVITPSFNNVADFQAILATGAEPVFCDIDTDSLCIDLASAEKLISAKTKAVIVMDYQCMLCDHDGVAVFAKEHGLRVVHDAAHSLGSTYKGRNVGSFSDLCMFSFDPIKSVTCVDGGALVLREEELGSVREMRLLGMGQPAQVMYQNRRAWTYDVARPGFRYHMANAHAAIGLQQLKKMDRITESRRAAARYYNDNLASLPDLLVPRTDFMEVTPFLYYVRVPGPRRDAFRTYLAGRGIETGIHWQPAHWFTLFKNCRKDDLSVTDRVGKEIVSLPLHSGIPRSSQDKVIQAIADYFRGQG